VQLVAQGKRRADNLFRNLIAYLERGRSLYYTTHNHGRAYN